MVADARKPGCPTAVTVNSTNRRRYVRRAVTQQAHLKAPGLSDVLCEIRNFCWGGLFVKINHKDISFAASRSALPKTVEVSFTASTSLGERPFTLGGRVAHASADGIGIAFERAPVDAIQVLREVAESKPPLLDSAADAGGLALARDSMQQTCADALERSLRAILESFFQRVPEALNDAADQAPSNMEQTACRDAIVELDHARETVIKEFIERALEQADGYAAAGSLYPGRPDTGSLALLDNEEFEDWLNLMEEVAKTEAIFGSELHVLEQRLSALAGIPVDNRNDPFGPNALGQCFRWILRDRAANNATRLILYRVFEQSLCAFLGELYQQLNAILPLAPIKAQGVHSSVNASAASLTVEDTDRCDDTPAGQPLKAPRLAPAPRQGITKTVSTLLELADWKHNPSARATATTGSAHEEADAERAARYQRSELLTALKALQQQKATGGSTYLSEQSLESELIGVLSQQLGDAKEISPSDQQTFQVVSSFLDTALTDPSLTPVVQDYIGNLQLPLLGLALKEPAFLDDASHPARRVLDLLGDLALAANDSGEITGASVELRGLVDRIVREAPNNPAVFAEAREELERIVIPLDTARAAQLERVRNACEARQRIEQARSLVEDAINQRIAGKMTPDIVLALLNGGWRQLLVAAQIRGGSDNADWSRGLAVVDKLLLWLAEETPSAESPVAEKLELINYVDLQLTSVSPDKPQQNKIIDELTALLIGAGLPKTKQKPDYSFVPEAPAEERDSKTAADELSVQLVEQLRVGDWLEFQLTPLTQTPLRLAWIGETPALYVFVDGQGIEKLEAGKQDLGQRFAAGRVKRIDNLDVPLVDRAADRMMQNMHDKLIQAATHDPVTGLINRKEFLRLLRVQSFALDQPHTDDMLCFLEIDQFRIINAGSGLEAGDTLLKGVSFLIQKRIQASDILARFGDNAFGILLKSHSGDEGYRIAKDLRRLITSYHFCWQDKSYSLGVSIGLAALTEHMNSVSALVNNADTACMAAKTKGRNHIQMYRETDSDLKAQQHLMDWAGRIDKMLKEDRLFLRCQLITPVSQSGADHSHYEILLGVKNDDGTAAAPGQFLAAVERCKRMPEIDRWVMRSSFDWIQANPEKFALIGGFSINLSGQSMGSEEILQFVHTELTRSDLSAEKITFEITETSAIANFAEAEKFIRQIKRYGCRFSLDDFGSGFSSYAYLKNLNVDFLKIDGSFVKELATSESDYVMVKSMNEIGHSLGIKTIAEYVENAEILGKLSEIGVDYAQGFGIQRPGVLANI